MTTPQNTPWIGEPGPELLKIQQPRKTRQPRKIGNPYSSHCTIWNFFGGATIGMTPAMLMIGSWRVGIVTATIGTFSYWQFWRALTRPGERS